LAIKRIIRAGEVRANKGVHLSACFVTFSFALLFPVDAQLRKETIPGQPPPTTATTTAMATNW